MSNGTAAATGSGSTFKMDDYYPGCTASTNQMVAAALAGAAVSYAGLTSLLPLPPIIHLAATGYAVGYYCVGEGGSMPELTATPTLKLMASSVAGGMIVSR